MSEDETPLHSAEFYNDPLNCSAFQREEMPPQTFEEEDDGLEWESESDQNDDSRVTEVSKIEEGSSEANVSNRSAQSQLVRMSNDCGLLQT
jgi:hypothetical protein